MSSRCEPNFTEIHIPVEGASSDDVEKDIHNTYVYNTGSGSDMIDMCVKRCNDGSLPINGYNLSRKKFVANLNGLTEGANFMCHDYIKNGDQKCKIGTYIVNENQDTSKCRYRPTQYPLEYNVPRAGSATASTVAGDATASTVTGDANE